MKNITGGSIQSRNGNLSYVFSVVDAEGGKTQKWVALKTRDMKVARERVRAQFGAAPVGENQIKWLRHLVKTGADAQAQLNQLLGIEAAVKIEWPDLWDKWLSAADELTDNERTLSAYRGQVRALRCWAESVGVAHPDDVLAADAQLYIKTRSPAAQKRDAAQFKRIWQDLELPQVWDKIKKQRAKKIPYRRLWLEEVVRLCQVLRDGGGNFECPQKTGDFAKQPDLLDMVLIGFYTALRRKDVQNLRVRNLDGDFIVVLASKTAHHEDSKPLTVPLIPAAREIVRRRAAAAGKDGYLFPALVGGSLDKALHLSFKRAGVFANDFGKASFHSLRATFISQMVDAGAQAHLTDAITGHSADGQMQGHYAQPSREALMAAVVNAIKPITV